MEFMKGLEDNDNGEHDLWFSPNQLAEELVQQRD